MENPAQVGGMAPDLSYRTTGGETRRLAELWSGTRALVLWLRHFG